MNCAEIAAIVHDVCMAVAFIGFVWAVVWADRK